jgi:hypothetical protein
LKWLFSYRPFWIIAAIALAVRLAWCIGILATNADVGFFQTDSEIYSHFAQTMLDYDQFAYYHPDLDAFYSVHSRTPGYPTFIYLFKMLGLGTLSIIITQVLLSVFTVVMTMRLTVLLLQNKRAASWAGLIVALDIPSIVFSNLVMSETLFTALLITVAFWIVRYLKSGSLSGRLSFVGAVLGVAVLCRPVGLYMVAGMALALWCFRTGTRASALKSVVIFVMGFALVLSGWMVRNKTTFDHAFITTLDNTNLFYYRAAGVVAREDNISLFNARVKLEKQYVDQYSEQFPNPYDLSTQLRNQAIEIIAEHPGTYAKIHAMAAIELLGKPMRQPIQMQFGWAKEEYSIRDWADANESSMWDQFKANASGFTMAMVFFQLLLLALLWLAFARGTLRLWKQKEWLTLFLALGMIAYFCLVAAGPETNARFRIPLLPFLAVVAGFGISILGKSSSTEG